MALLPSLATENTKTERTPGGSNLPSQGWLVDAFTAADSQARVQRAAEEKRLKEVQLSRGKTGSAAAPNPFSPFMSQWLSPHDPVLQQITRLDGQLTGTAGTDSFDHLNSNPTNASAASNSTKRENGANGLSLMTLSAPSANPAVGVVTANPYLPADNAAPSGVGNKPNAGASAAGLVPSSRPSGGATSLPTGRRPAKLAEPAYTPPTAPLIDERKYFPQLHRF